jgi:hypothetical protein
MKSFHELAAEVAMEKLKSNLAKEAKKAPCRSEDIAEEHGCSCNDGGECKCDTDADCCDCNATNEAAKPETNEDDASARMYRDNPNMMKQKGPGGFKSLAPKAKKTIKKTMKTLPTPTKEATIPDGQTVMTKKPDLTNKDKKTMGKIADLMKRANEDVKVKSADKKSELVNVDGKLVTRMVPTTKRQADKKDDVEEGKKPGLWANMHARRKAGKPKLKPGDKNYPKTLDIESKEESANLKLINRIKNSGVVKTGSMSKDAPVKKTNKDQE